MNLVNHVNPVKLCAAHTSAGMKITQDVREYAATHGVSDANALRVGMEEKRVCGEAQRDISKRVKSGALISHRMKSAYKIFFAIPFDTATR